MQWCSGAAVPIPHAPCLWVTCKGAHTRDRMTHLAICTHEAVSTPTEGELLKQNILLAIASAQLVLFRHHSSSPLLLPLVGRITCHHCNPTKKKHQKKLVFLCVWRWGVFLWLESAGTTYLVYHASRWEHTGTNCQRYMMVDKLTWNADGWPMLATRDGAPSDTPQPTPR